MKVVSYKLFKYSLFLLFLESMFAWFLWDLKVIVLLIAVALSFLFIISSYDLFVFRKGTIIIPILLFATKLFLERDVNLVGIIALLLSVTILSIVLLLEDEIKIQLFQFITRIFAILLAVSMIGWILFLMEMPLPHKNVQFLDPKYALSNYYLFLFNLKEPFVFIPRFSSVFLEPGHLGMITTFLLVANRFEIRRLPVMVILIATLFTFSLAAYVMLILSASVFLLVNSKKPFLYFALLIVFLATAYSYFNNLNDGENIVNTLIIDRLQYEDGDIAGNDRFSDKLDIYYDTFMDSRKKYFGIGPYEFSKIDWDKGVAGYKVFIIEYGIVGTVLVFLLYLFILLGNSSKMAWVLLATYILCFLQAAYPLWECELLIFITACPYFQINQVKLNDSDYG